MGKTIQSIRLPDSANNLYPGMFYHHYRPFNLQATLHMAGIDHRAGGGTGFLSLEKVWGEVVVGSWRYAVRGARYAVRGARYAVRGMRYAVRGF